jgi:hypothetical protein
VKRNRMSGASRAPVAATGLATTQGG